MIKKKLKGIEYRDSYIIDNQTIHYVAVYNLYLFRIKIGITEEIIKK